MSRVCNPDSRSSGLRYLATCRLELARYESQQSGLSGAVAAHYANNLTRGKIETNPAKNCPPRHGPRKHL